MSNFSQRLLTGTVYVLLIFLSLIFNSIAFGLLTVVFTFIAIGEFLRMSMPDLKNGRFVNQLVHSLIVLATVFISYFQFSTRYILVIGLVASIFFFIKALFQKNNNPVQSLSMNILAFAYITIPLILINFTSDMSANYDIPFVLIMFVIIWANDTFAYLFGIAFGKHKIFERISPKKSWEGFIGGLLMVVVATIIINYLYPKFGHLNWVLFGLIASVASVLGDFIESMFKRNFGVKDSGSILPGHGGILDRIDSMLLAAPAIYIFLNFILK